MSRCLKFEVAQAVPQRSADLVEVIEVNGLETDLAAEFPHLSRLVDAQRTK